MTSTDEFDRHINWRLVIVVTLKFVKHSRASHKVISSIITAPTPNTDMQTSESSLSIRVGQLNVRSLRRKTAEVVALLADGRVSSPVPLHS